jgi:hypothetical protein
VLFDDEFGAGDFAFASVAVLFDDFGEVVDVVDVEIVKIGGGIDVAGDAEIHDEEGAIGARGHGGFEGQAREDGFFGRDGRDYYVWRGESGIPVAPVDYAAAELGGQGLRFVARTIHHMEMSYATVTEGGDDLLADGAGTENEGGAVSELAEDALGKFYSGGGYGHRARAQFSFGADALAGFEGALEEAIEDGAGGAVFVGDAVGFSDLAEDFGFAEEKRIEPGGNAEEMANSGAVVMVIEDAVEGVGANGMEFAEEGREAGGALVRGFRRDAVDFAAIAGGEDQGFFEEAAGTELVGGAASLLGGEGDALAELEGGGAMI